MTETFITRAQGNHNTFGGIIYKRDIDYIPSDSNEKNGSYIASKIKSDMDFDYRCRLNSENLKRNKKENIKNGKM